MRIPLGLLLLGCAATLGGAQDEDFHFDRLVSDVERHYGKRRLHIPFLGVASFLSGVARPLGASGVKLAVIEDVERGMPYSPRLPLGWRPLVRVTRKGQEDTAIFGRDEGRSVNLLLLTQDGGDAVVLQCKMHPSRVLEYLVTQARRHQ